MIKVPTICSKRPCLAALLAWLLGVAALHVQAQEDRPFADPAQLAFEEGRWEDAIREYREILDGFPEDRLSWLRIAMAERELGRHELALATLERALANSAPEAMVHVERARNFLGLGRLDDAIAALETADHLELRARVLLEEARDFDPLRGDPRFQRIYRNVRARVFPCEGIPAAAAFDFWLGDWEVRGPDGVPLGRSRVIRDEGGCAVREQWRGIAGSSGTSTSVYVPSRGQWRHFWVGSSGTMIEMAGELVDGEMRMEGTIEYLDQDYIVAFRSVWSLGGGGRVRQRMEQFNVANQGWEVWFDGIYSRAD